MPAPHSRALQVLGGEEASVAKENYVPEAVTQ